MMPILKNNITIKILKLSANSISDQGIKVFAEQYLAESSYLLELYLKWNSITSEGGKCIAEALQQNNNLSVLDLSYNRLGVSYPKIKSCSSILKAISQKSSSMKHLDISFNQICVQELKEIANILEDNHTLFGLHLSGNSDNICFMDQRGHLKFKGEQLPTNN